MPSTPYPLGSGLAELADVLSAAGVPAYVDPRDLNPPCAWLEPVGVSVDGLEVGVLTVALTVHLIAAGGHTVPQQLDEIGRLYAGAVDVLGNVDGRPAGVNLPNLSPDPLPALSLTGLSIDISPTEE